VSVCVCVCWGRMGKCGLPNGRGEEKRDGWTCRVRRGWAGVVLGESGREPSREQGAVKMSLPPSVCVDVCFWGGWRYNGIWNGWWSYIYEEGVD
jgi:hypothetical protein